MLKLKRARFNLESSVPLEQISYFSLIILGPRNEKNLLEGSLSATHQQALSTR